LSAQASARLLELVGEFDAMNALRFWTEVRSLAHWLAWSCSMTLPTARGACPGGASAAPDAHGCRVVR
jgi:hypothetical protein